MKLIVQNVYLSKTNKDFLSSYEVKKEVAYNFNMLLDKNGFLRVKARLQNSLLEYETKFPILLSKCNLLVRVIIFDTERLYILD